MNQILICAFASHFEFEEDTKFLSLFICLKYFLISVGFLRMGTEVKQPVSVKIKHMANIN